MTSLIKKSLFKIALILIILFTGTVCIYTTLNHKSSSASNQYMNERGNSFRKNTNQNTNNSGSANNTSNSVNQSSRQQNAQNTQNTQNTGNISSGSNNQAQQNVNNASGASNNLPSGGQSQNSSSNGFTWGSNGGMRSGASNTDNKYSYYLIGYFIIFIGLCIAAYYYLIHKKITLGNEKLLISAIVLAGLFLRLTFGVLTQGFSGDLSLFGNWATNAAKSLSTFYSNSRNADYPPFYIYILFLVGKIASTTAMSPYFTLLLKVPSILADVLSAYLIYRTAKKHLSMEMSIFLSAFYIFNPATFINSTFWGQVDSFFTLIVILGMYMLSEKKIGLSAALFTVAVLMKPQGIIFLPVLFFELVRGKNIKDFLKAAAFAVGTAIIVILPFSLKQSSPLWIVKLYSSTVSEYPYASVNAYNFFNLIGANYQKDSSILFLFSYHTWGMIFIVLTTLFSWFIYIKGNNRKFAFAAALIQIAGVFTFSVGMHERYLFPAAALAVLAFIYLKDRRLLLLALGFSITIFSNTHAVLYNTNFSDAALFTSLANVLLFTYLVKIMIDIAVKKKITQIG